MRRGAKTLRHWRSLNQRRSPPDAYKKLLTTRFARDYGGPDEKHATENRLMTGAVPPIKYKGSNEPPYKTLNKRRHGMRDVKEGPLVHPTIPCDPGEKNDSHLTTI